MIYHCLVIFYRRSANARNSVITASEEFRWEQSGNERTSQYNSNIALRPERNLDNDEDDEGRMRF